MDNNLLMVASGEIHRQPGYFTRIENETRFLVRYGHQIRLLVLCQKHSTGQVSEFLTQHYTTGQFTVIGVSSKRWLKSPQMILAIIQEILSFRPNILHSQALFAQIHAFITCSLTRCHNHYDIHGATYYEEVEGGSVRAASIKGRLLRWIDAFMVRRAGSKTFVSGKMLSFYNPGSGAWRIMPCCVDTARFQFSKAARERIRRSFGWKDKYVFCFLGNMNDPWQKPHAVLNIFGQIAPVLGQTHLLIISPPLRNSGCVRLPAESTWVSLSPDQVPDYLSASDVGLLIRDDLVTNRVAAPTKFGEYMASGVPVIISEGVGDYSEFVQQHDLGLVLDAGDRISPDRLKQLVNNLTTLRRSTRRFAVEHLGWERSIQAVMELYKAHR